MSKDVHSMFVIAKTAKMLINGRGWFNKMYIARHHWLRPVILAAWEAEIRRIVA
jgi:hypothetical protein